MILSIVNTIGVSKARWMTVFEDGLEGPLFCIELVRDVSQANLKS